MFKLADSVDGSVLWANLYLLFWSSLLPFATGWIGRNHFARGPAALYGVNLLCCANAYAVLQRRIIPHHGPGSRLEQAVSRDFKGNASPLLYPTGVCCVWFSSTWVGMAPFVTVALVWLTQDRRVENALTNQRMK